MPAVPAPAPRLGARLRRWWAAWFGWGPRTRGTIDGVASAPGVCRCAEPERIEMWTTRGAWEQCGACNRPIAERDGAA
jgi:hypothetical protein